MNVNESVAEPHCDFVRRIGVLDYPMGLDADIAGGLTLLPGPTPYVAEHTLVQFA